MYILCNIFIIFRCNFIGTPGWRCGKNFDGECIPEDWVCDGDIQCPLGRQIR